MRGHHGRPRGAPVSTPAQVSADLRGLGPKTRLRVATAVRDHGSLLLAEVKRRANVPRTVKRPGVPGGTDGPRLLTGHYNRSIAQRFTETRTRATAEVGTNAPQGRRLELGFHGTDALGRSYQQRPYPHFGPALDEIGPRFARALAEAVKP